MFSVDDVVHDWEFLLGFDLNPYSELSLLLIKLDVPINNQKFRSSYQKTFFEPNFEGDIKKKIQRKNKNLVVQKRNQTRNNLNTK
ncbi:hypothetical protein BpHYR1_034425 [Brachionus plicatilis]|uniref:Uncharacterized protein n=1 Tax=Brachionus plicatilis TaxID=10195 RepID=A0A3M7TAU4_BRAPC|nr:hypothetical protein BpHYR1_034425 [Brachionus plicatilis]